MENTQALHNSLRAISNEIGILTHYVELPKYPTDPKIINCGIWSCNTQYIDGEKFGGRSGGCGYEWDHTILSTIGETMERYACAFYDKKEIIYSSYKELPKKAIHPSQFSLLHENQYSQKNFPLKRFDEEVEVSWFPCTDLITGEECYIPGQFIYIPFSLDKNIININTSTGLAAHTNMHKAILTGLYECIERDCFVLTWMHNHVAPKIIISTEIQQHLNAIYPSNFEWHFFDITYDLQIPTVYGICTGTTEYGRFIAVGSATRSTMGAALKKVIQEIGQAIPYFRWVLGENEGWEATDDFYKITSFEHHSIFYLKRKDMWQKVFGHWFEATPSVAIDFNEPEPKDDITTINQMLSMFSKMGYNVVFKDLTTPDIDQVGYKSIKVLIPQLLQLSGAYPFYFNGAQRLYEVPEKLGWGKKTYEDLNKFPHPFP